MFQNFNSFNHKPYIKERIQHLRSLFLDHKIDGYFVPHGDAFQNEYLPDCYKRLEYMTNFTGSWGMALILHDKAFLFVDSRYAIQAPTETDTECFQCVCISNTSFKEFFNDLRFNTLNFGYDPALFTQKQMENFTTYLPNTKLTAIDHNLVDMLPKEKEHPFPETEIIIYPHEYAGKTSIEKLSDICADMKKEQIDHAIIALPESLCWLLNVRAKDVLHTPYILSYGILHQDTTLDWFVGTRRITSQIQAYLPPNIHIHNLDDFYHAIAELSGNVQNDLNNNIKISQLLAENTKIARVINKDDPCLLPKAIKNDAEINATRQAHIRDGAAVIRFAYWLENNSAQNITEIDCVKQLEKFRDESGALQDISFDTIAGTGAHGAIVHYRVTEQTNQTLKEGDLFLLDSGGQYLDGTTDITRTFAIGTPSQEMKTRYTQVLKGHLALSMARFPEKTTGATLDVLARMPLWQAGIDYGHGTGHGVGVYLSVHEGPQSISARSNVPLVAGMILSNEPGYYKQDAFGIRIENLELVTKPHDIHLGEKPMMGFETLTMVPYEKKLIDYSALTQEEITYIEAYHRQILKIMQPLLDQQEYDYLTRLCK